MSTKRACPRMCRDDQMATYEKVAELTRAGKTVPEIAAIVGYTERHITRIRARMGCSGPRWQPWTEAETRRALEMLEDGCSYSEVGRTLGRSGTTIGDRFPGYGWPPGEGSRYAILRRLENSLGIAS